MALFAFSLLFGALLAGIDLADPRLRESIRNSIPGLWPRLTWALLLIIVFFASLYLVFYLDYYQVEAPSIGFRRFTFFKRALEHAPLMLTAAAVAFHAVHWLHRTAAAGARNVIPRGIGIAGAGLLILGLFLLQDWRGSPLVQKLNTPVFSLEFSRSVESAPSKPYLPEHKNINMGFGKDPIEQSLYLLRFLGITIGRDKEYIELFAHGFAADPKLARINAALVLEKPFYTEQIGALVECLRAIREPVQDLDPLIIMDGEIARTLRELHRLNLTKAKGTSGDLSEINARLSEIRSDFEAKGEDAETFNPLKAARLKKLKEIKDYRYKQHSSIDPRLRKHKEDCEEINEQFVTKLYSDELLFSAATPYFTLAVASTLNAMNEKLAAVEEIDTWLKYHDDTQSKPEVRGSAEFIIDRVFKLRVEFWAGFFLVQEPKYINLGLRRYRRAIEAADDIFKNSSPDKWTKPLERLFEEVDIRNETLRNKTKFCSDLDGNAQRLLFSTINMVNTIVFYAIANDLRVLDTDYSDYVGKYHDVLAFVDGHCFRKVLDKDSELNIMAELTDTYLDAKRTLLRELPEERVRFELCRMKDPLARADKYSRELEQGGVVKENEKKFVDAEALFEIARRLKRSVTAFNEASAKTGPRGCVVDVAKGTDVR